MRIPGLANLASLALALSLAACGGGSGRGGTDVSVTGTGPTGELSAGASAQFVMTVTNAGQYEADGVSLTDTLGRQLDLQSITCTGSGASCPSATGTSMTVNLPAGSSLTFTVNTTVNNTSAAAGSAPDLSNRLTASFDNDYDNSNNTYVVSADGSSAQLVLSGSAPAGQLTSGAPVAFTLSLLNNGPDAATNLAITNRLTLFAANSLQITCTATQTVSTNSTAPACPSTLGASMTLDSLPAGGKLVFNVAGTVASQANGTVQDVMAVTADNNSNRSSASYTVSESAVTAEAGVFVTGSGPSGVVNAGSTANFLMTVTNAGPSAATNVTILDSVNGNLTLLPASSTCTVLPSSATFNCPTFSPAMTIASLPAGVSLQFNVAAQVANSVYGDISNQMTVSSDNDPDRSDNSVTVTASSGLFDIAVTGQPPSSVVPGGSPAAFTMIVTNNGPNGASNVAITDTAAGNFALGTITCTSAGGAVCPTTPGASMTSPSIPANGSLTFVVNGTTTAGQQSQAANTMAITAAGDSHTGNDSATASVSTASTSDLSVSEAAVATSVPAGSPATFRATIVNGGSGSLSDVAVNETLAGIAGLAVTSVTCDPSASSGTCPDNPTTSTTLSTLGAGKQVTLVYTVNVPAGTASGSISSAVVVSAAGDTDASDNNASASTQVVNAASGSYAVFTADGRQFTMNLDVDAMHYTLVSADGSTTLAQRTLRVPVPIQQNSPIDASYQVSVNAGALMRLATDLVVGSDAFTADGTGTPVPYVAARQFYTNLNPVVGNFNLAVRNVTSTGASTHVATASLAAGQLQVCKQDAGIAPVRSCDSGSVQTYVITGGSNNVFTATNVNSGQDVFTFEVARSQGTAMLLSTSMPTGGGTQTMFGLRDAAALAGGIQYGPGIDGTSTVVGDWTKFDLTAVAASTVTLTSEVPVVSPVQYTMPALPTGSGGPFAARQISAGAGQTLFVIQSYPITLVVGDHNGANNGTLDVAIP